MAPTNRLEREAEDLAKEYHNASIATRSAMASQNRLTQILSKHANTVVASIASMVQDIAHAKTNTALKKQEIEVIRTQLTIAKKKHDSDMRALQDNARQRDEYRSLTAKGRTAAGRSLAEEIEYQRLRAIRGTLRDNLNKASEAERKSSNSVNALEQSTRLKTSELKNIKLTAFATTVNSANTEMQKLVGAINKTQEQFGIAAGQAANLKVDNIVSSFNSYVESAKSLFSGKPEFGVSAEMIERAQAAYQNEFGGILTTDAAKDLAMQARTMGVTTEQLTKARRVFTAQSLGNVAEAKKSQDKFIAEFAKKGLTSKDAMQAISQYSELLARNGTRFAQSFTRAAADAKKIGIDLNKVSQFGDSLINNFEGFLEGTAALGAMGFNLDSNRLAQISETGSDADLYNELKSQLANTGKDITKLRRSERLELESMFGMTISDMQKMAGETPDGDTKSPEELQAEGNGFLNRMAVGIDLLTKLAGIAANAILATIAFNTGITAFATSGMAAPIMAAAAGIATIAAAIALFKFGSKNVEEGKRKIAAGEEGGVGQLIKGRTQQGAGIGAGGGASLAGIGAGLLLMGSGVGIPAGLAVIGASMAAGGLVGGTAGGILGAGEGAIEAAATKGDDVISQPGYGKRSLVTPSGVIALNNKDNIIAYADDLAGTTKLPYGSIAKKAGEKYEQLDVFKKQVNDVFSGLVAPNGGFGKVSKFINTDLNKPIGGAVAKAQELKAGGTGGLLSMAQGKLSGLFGGKAGESVAKAQELKAGGTSGLLSMAQNKFGGMFGGKAGGAIAKAQELKAGGTSGLLSMAQNKFGDMFGGKAGGAMSSISNLFTGGGSTTSNLMGMATKIPGLGGLLGKATGLLGGGGLKGVAGSLLGKVGLGSLGGSLLGGPMGLAGSLAAPLLKKIPLVGGALASIAGGPGKLMGSALGKIGGFLGSKKGKGVVSSIAGGPMGLAAPLLKKIPLVGGALASIAGGPGKLMGSALGKIGGLFGKKKAPAVSAMSAMMPDMGNMMSMLPFLSGTQSTAAQGTSQPQAPISVDTAGIEKQLNNFINALQGIQIHMDGAKVGKALVNSNDAASSLGVFREQSR